MINLTKKFSFSCAHRIVGHPSKCVNLHGHDYHVTVEISDDREYDRILSDNYPILYDFGDVKERFGSWIEKKWDHSIILWEKDKELVKFFRNFKIDSKNRQKIYIMDSNVTSESLAKELLDVFYELNSVTIEEGMTSSVTVYRDKKE